jgi:hypothetical protein
MPYFLCPACALRAYSAASECRCPNCDRPLQRDNQLHLSVPRAEALRTTREDPTREGLGRFRRRARDGVPEGGVQ